MREWQEFDEDDEWETEKFPGQFDADRDDSKWEYDEGDDDEDDDAEDDDDEQEP